MPTDACQSFCECRGCGVILRRNRGTAACSAHTAPKSAHRSRLTDRPAVALTAQIERAQSRTDHSTNFANDCSWPILPRRIRRLSTYCVEKLGFGPGAKNLGRYGATRSRSAEGLPPNGIRPALVLSVCLRENLLAIIAVDARWAKSAGRGKPSFSTEQTRCGPSKIPPRDVSRRVMYRRGLRWGVAAGRSQGGDASTDLGKLPRGASGNRAWRDR